MTQQLTHEEARRQAKVIVDQMLVVQVVSFFLKFGSIFWLGLVMLINCKKTRLEVKCDSIKEEF